MNLVLKGIDSSIKNLVILGMTCITEVILTTLYPVMPPDDRVMGRVRWLASHLMTDCLEEAPLYLWLENWKEARTAAPPLELKHHWHCANFLLQLFTDKAGQDRWPLLLCLLRGIWTFYFWKGIMCFVPGVYYLILMMFINLFKWVNSWLF